MFHLFIVIPLIVSASACNNMIAGIDKLASGVDITKYDNSGLNRGTWTGGSKYPLIAISCKKNESWMFYITLTMEKLLTLSISLLFF